MTVLKTSHLGMRALAVVEFEVAAEETAALILILEKRRFAKGFIPQSIGIDGDFAPWVGALIANVNNPF
jgi:hypothetical protein